MPLLLRLATRNVLRQRRRSLLTILSMAGGYLLCCLSFSLVNGSYGNIIRLFTEEQTGHVQIHKDDYAKKPRIHKTIDDPDAVARVLQQYPDIRAFTPRVFAPALAYANNKNTPVQVTGVDVISERVTSRLEKKLTQGQWLAETPDSDGYFSAIVGQGVADTLNLALGDELVLISQGADGSVANDIFIIGGFVGDKRSTDRLTVFLPLNAAQEFLTLEGRVHEFAILLADIETARKAAADLQVSLPELKVAPWQEVMDTFYKSMEADRRGNQVTLGIILFIVFIGVLNTVLMSVLERTREFGVLKAIGSRPGMIVTLIVLETGVLAALSIALGLLLAVPANIWFTYQGFALPEPVDMGGVAVQYMRGELSLEVFLLPMAILYGYAIVVSIPPGLRAARVPPIEAMRTY
ncbi:MAG: ABC transporter permease [Pseudomonadota bacterium]